MANINKVILIGYLGRDPDIRYTQTGRAVANFSIATTEQWTKNGEKQEHTEWHTIIAWGHLGEICKEYLKKGSLIYIEGRIRTREWTDMEGAKRRSKAIIVDAMQMLTSKNKVEDSSPKPERNMEDDIPF